MSAKKPEAAPEPQPSLHTRGSNQVGLRQFNERMVLHALRLHKTLSKAQLARLTGLTAQTIGLITARLEEDELIVRHDAVRGNIGQPFVPLTLNPRGAYAIGIKIGRRTTDTLLVDFLGQVIDQRTVRYAFPEAATLLPEIESHIQVLTKALRQYQHRLVGVGLATPFHLGGWHKLLGVDAAKSAQWNKIDLQAQVQAMVDVPVSLTKDTVAASAAELALGLGIEQEAQLKNFLYLFVDTFVGGGLVLGGKLHQGLRGNAGAVASLPAGLVAGSLTGAGNAAKPAPPTPSTPLQPPAQIVELASLWELEQAFAAKGLDISATHDERALSKAYAPLTEMWLSHAASALAHTIINAAALLDIPAVVMDGSVCPALLQQLLERTRAALQGYNWEGATCPTLHAGSFGAQARALGGAWLPLHENFAPDADVFHNLGR